ncbi:MAG: hypothetical protein JXA60_10445 [Candidatus Coatesbacteria bacterium]|nr:hypothetical protein [Candidatus Coatesbacteria bacterium]
MKKQVDCLKCGNKLELDLINKVVKCPYCDQYQYFDITKMVLSFVLAQKIKEQDSLELLKSYLKSESIESTDISNPVFSYLPFWVIEMKNERIIESGNSSITTSIFTNEIEIGEISDIESGEISNCYQPDISIDKYLENSEFKQAILAFVPFYIISFIVKNEEYIAYIDATKGKIHINQTPPNLRKEYLNRLRNYFVTVFSISFIVFLLWEVKFPAYIFGANIYRAVYLEVNYFYIFIKILLLIVLVSGAMLAKTKYLDKGNR